MENELEKIRKKLLLSKILMIIFMVEIILMIIKIINN